MGKTISPNMRKLMQQLGVLTPEEVKAFYKKNSEEAAETVRKVLADTLDSIRSTSRSQNLAGYEAVKAVMTRDKVIHLQKSGIDIPIDTEWLVYVQQPHEAGDFNAFDLLNEGRPRLPKKSVRPSAAKKRGYPKKHRKSSRKRKIDVYVLPASVMRKYEPPKKRSNAQERKPSRYGRRFVSNSRIRDRGEIARPYPVPEEHTAGYRQTPHDRSERVFPIQFSQGPIAAVKARKLYDRVWKRGKLALSGSGYRGWKIIVARGVTRGKK